MREGAGPEPDFFPQHSAEDLIHKFKVNTVVSRARNSRTKLPQLTNIGAFHDVEILPPESQEGSRKDHQHIVQSWFYRRFVHLCHKQSRDIRILPSKFTDNKEGECLAYRISKAALNQLTVTMANEFKIAGDNIAVVSVYPGYVATKMTNYRHKNDMAECIEGIVKVVEGVDMSKTGTFVDWKNETFPW